MTDSVLAALPSRPLRARPPRHWMQYVWSLVGLLIFAGMLAFSVVYVAPVLATDWWVRGSAVELSGAHISDGSCSGNWFIETCDATLSLPAARITREVHYMFVSFNTRGWVARVVGDPNRPTWLTTDLGLERFWQRSLFLLLGCAFLLAVILAGGRAKIRTWRNNMSWRRAEVVPVRLKFVKRQVVRGGALWIIRGTDGRAWNWTMSRRAAPFMLGQDEVLGLELRNGAAFPLDAGLRWIDLSPGERRPVLAARNT